MKEMRSDTPSSILWQRLDRPGYDSCMLRPTADRWRLGGTAVFSERRRPCRLDYEVVCDREWNTLYGTVRGWFGTTIIAVNIEADPSIGWRMNGGLIRETRGCSDLDLSFTPATNLIPIRRLGLPVSGTGPSIAAWLSFPELVLGRLEQTYGHTDELSYKYGTADGYENELGVNRTGFVTHYRGRWKAVAP